MRRTFSYIFLIILFFVSSTLAQSDYKIELSGGRITSGIQNTLLKYWDTGWSLGITASKKLNKGIELTSSFRIQNFRFQPDRLELTSVYLEFPSPSLSVNGENSYVYNFTVGIRVGTSAGRIKSFISFSGGLQYIKQGKIFIAWSEPPFKGSTLLTSSSLYNSSNQKYLMGIVEVGAGLSFNILPKINLITQGRLVTTLKRTTSYPILSTGIQYSF